MTPIRLTSLAMLLLATADTGRSAESPATPQVAILRPQPGSKVTLSKGSTGIFRMDVVGSSKNVAGKKLQLLLWVRPVNPAADGWYLQRSPTNGISEVEPDGSWRGVAQLGNVDWPPQPGHTLEIAVTIVDVKTAQELLSSSKASWGQPVGESEMKVGKLVVAQ